MARRARTSPVKAKVARSIPAKAPEFVSIGALRLNKVHCYEAVLIVLGIVTLALLYVAYSGWEVRMWLPKGTEWRGSPGSSPVPFEYQG